VMRRFDPYFPSQHEPLAQLVEHLTFNQGVEGSSPSWLTLTCGSGSGVEHRLAKARVAGSNPVFRSKLIGPLVKRFNTLAFHASMQGFESPTGHQMRTLSSAGRASALQAEGRRFDPVSVHHHTEGYQSGQMGRTVNPLALPS
jgi:hypothetical protein